MLLKNLLRGFSKPVAICSHTGIQLHRVLVTSCEFRKNFVTNLPSSMQDQYYDVNADEYSFSNRKPSSEPVYVETIIPKTKDEFDSMRSLPFVQPAVSRLLRVSILGLPNAGKSTLTNSLLDRRVCSVSKKVHTTRHNTTGVLTVNETQIVFLDTPGIISSAEFRKYKLDHSLFIDPDKSVKDADLIAVMVDASNRYTCHTIDKRILSLLEANKTKRTILILNKVDYVKSKNNLLELSRLLSCGVVGRRKAVDQRAKRPVVRVDDEGKRRRMEKLFKRTEEKLSISKQPVECKEPSPDEVDCVDETVAPSSERGWPHFEQIFMTSAANGDGIDRLRDYMVKNAKYSPWVYPGHVLTDQNPYEIATMAVREKMMDYLPHEVPYTTKLRIQMWEVDEHGVLKILMQIFCKRDVYARTIVGRGGAMISRLADEARQSLMNTFHTEVSLKLIVEMKEPRTNEPESRRKSETTSTD